MLWKHLVPQSLLLNLTLSSCLASPPSNGSHTCIHAEIFADPDTRQAQMAGPSQASPSGRMPWLPTQRSRWQCPLLASFP